MKITKDPLSAVSIRTQRAMIHQLEVFVEIIKKKQTGGVSNFQRTCKINMEHSYSYTITLKIDV